jgi:hypothetical protein
MKAIMITAALLLLSFRAACPEERSDERVALNDHINNIATSSNPNMKQ